MQLPAYLQVQLERLGEALEEAQAEKAVVLQALGVRPLVPRGSLHELHACAKEM